MRYRTVKASELASCRARRLDVGHYLPEHKTEQCDPEAAKRLAAAERKIRAAAKKKIDAITTTRDRKLARAATRIRRAK